MCGGILGALCEEGTFCKYETGACGTGDQSGVCTAIPDACAEIYAPVCGCDGETYGNECEAEMAGVSVDYLGECEQATACSTNGDCAETEYCLLTACAAETGTCADRPEVCTLEWAPVCGCDGETYGNECEAAAAGVNVDYDGECESTACWTNDDCTETEYCLLDTCAAETGMCADRPDVCTEEWTPVCGCDGETYSNACQAAAAGVNVDYDGECEE